MKDEFLATLSHELRTPLNTVLGYTAMLQKGTLGTERWSKAIEVIHRNALVLTDLVGELLDTSRVVTGKIRLDGADGLVRPGGRSQLRTSVRRLPPRASGLDVRIERGIGIVADRDRLRQVLWNLLTNAVKFTPGDERIEVQSLGRALEGAHRRS